VKPVKAVLDVALRDWDEKAGQVIERDCPESMAGGYTVALHPTRPGVKIYKECKECRGKGRVVAD
jgi:hypothetical protein